MFTEVVENNVCSEQAPSRTQSTAAEETVVDKIRRMKFHGGTDILRVASVVIYLGALTFVPMQAVFVACESVDVSNIETVGNCGHVAYSSHAWF